MEQPINSGLGAETPGMPTSPAGGPTSKSKAPLVILLVLLGLLLIGGVVYAFGFVTKSETNVFVSPSPSTSVVDISNWQTYRNDKYGFELQYPSNLRERDQDELDPLCLYEGNCVSLTSKKPESGTEFIVVYYDGIRQVSTSVGAKQPSSLLEYFKDPMFGSYKEITLAGVKGYEVTAKNDAVHTQWQEIWIEHNGYIFQIKDFSDQNILSTFKFTTPTATISQVTTNWKTYTNSKYRFEVKYPSSWTIEEDFSFPTKQIILTKDAKNVIAIHYVMTLPEYLNQNNYYRNNGITLSEYLNTEVKNGNLSNVQPSTLAGIQGYEYNAMAYKYTKLSTQAARYGMVVVYKGSVYEILFSVSEDDLTVDERQVISSFKFIN